MVMFSVITFQKELPEGKKKKEEEEKKSAADNMLLLQSRWSAAEYGSLLGAKKK